MNTNYQNNKKSKHGKHKPNYYKKNKQKYLLANQKYRTKLKAQKSPKQRSFFLIQREQKFINCLDKHHLVVPVPRLKIKHPIIQGWNKPNWWWKAKIPQLLAQGHNYFTLLNKDGSYKGVRIGCIDIDEKGWTKIPTKYWCCYISADNGKIKLLFLYEDNCDLKTGKGYFQGQPILDFKISGGIMGIGSFHPNGKPYRVKGAGSFFLKNNHIFKSPQEVIELLKRDWQIEVKTMSEHFSHAKIIEKMLDYQPLFKETAFIPSREPPIRELNNLSKITNY
ncbi:hypothetical protein [endosymbiont GvMRE of Glomus versiforme]|uniref:hypothetical protein n=1 Tax=endosymbiont GvMRE of Glomus versiforme TaxID=2039283 RepID=UPI000EC6F818|nr:hypothetical protein [endosymbiont GvMRE of Glomus versiforme]RHZ35860.1 hypothetical protein GvMRE_Ic4g137 [endosymbiont GvMRE of Glomus versiforme]